MKAKGFKKKNLHLLQTKKYHKYQTTHFCFKSVYVPKIIVTVWQQYDLIRPQRSDACRSIVSQSLNVTAFGKPHMLEHY